LLARIGRREAAVHKAATIVLGLEPPELAEEVMDFLDRTGRTRVIGMASSGADLGRAVRERRPNAVVAQPRLIHGAGPLDGSAFLALSTTESVAELREALRIGARGFYLWPDERGELARAASMAVPPPERPDGSRALMVAVYGPRGGAGTTFVATHLAASFARDGKAAVLVDLDPLFGDVTAAIGVPPDPAPKTMADLAPVADELGAPHLDEALWRHPAGFRALLAPADARGRERIGLFQYTAALSVLQTTADIVVLHLPRALDKVAMAGLEMADRILLVLSLDVLAFRSAKRALAVLESAGLEGRCEIVVNRAARGDIVPSDVRRVFGVEAATVLRSDRAIPSAQDRGALLPPRNATAKALDRLAKALQASGPRNQEALDATT
jgi:pilus assembly protein CpaE